MTYSSAHLSPMRARKDLFNLVLRVELNRKRPVGPVVTGENSRSTAIDTGQEKTF